MVEQTLGLELAPHLHVVVETAGGEHHPATRGHRHLTSVLLDDGTGDTVPVGEQTHQRRLGPHRDTGLQHPREQTGGDRLSTRDVFTLDGETGDTLGEPLEDARKTLVRHAQHEVHPLVVGTGGGHRQARLHEARTQSTALLTEDRQVEGQALAAAADRRTTRQFGVIVGVALGPEQLHGGGALEHLDGGDTVVDEGLAPLDRRRAVDDRPHVGVAALDGVAASRRGEYRIGRHPECTAGTGGRSADVGRLLHDESGQARLVRGERSGHAGTGPDHEQVHGRIAGCGHGRYRGLGHRLSPSHRCLPDGMAAPGVVTCVIPITGRTRGSDDRSPIVDHFGEAKTSER